MTNQEHIEELAKKYANNHTKFSDFAWFDRPKKNANEWALIYTSNRDSGLLDQSNEHVINKALKPFSRGNNCDVKFERHQHWAVGYVSGFAIRVYKNGKITKAFKTWAKLKIKMENYPLLDEDDYSQREYDETIENIKFEGCNLVKENAPKNWSEKVFGYLWEHNPEAIAGIDDRGGYPSKDIVKEALNALKMLEN